MATFKPVTWLREHERGADALLALAVTGLSFALHYTVDVDIAADTDGVRAPTWWSPAFVVAAAAPIYWRRSSPVVATLVVVVAQVTASLMEVQAASFLGAVIALYSLAAHADGPRRTRAAAVCAALIGALFVAGVLIGPLSIGNLISSSIILVTAFVLGDNLRRRRQHVAALAERAERAEREQTLIAEQQVSAERTRIARELHDVVAHSVSVMVIQSAAARRNLRTDPALAEQTLTTLEATGRQTMDEMRSILGVLRRDAELDGATGTVDSRAPQPTLDDIARLVDDDGELPVALTIDPALHGQDVRPSVSMTAYRIVQEALTNVRRHAGPVRAVEVHLQRTGAALSVAVVDDGRGAAADRLTEDGDETACGFGLIGMRERVAAVGGSLVAGPQRGGGWHVQATIPLNTTAGDRSDDARTGRQKIGAPPVDGDDRGNEHAGGDAR